MKQDLFPETLIGVMIANRAATWAAQKRDAREPDHVPVLKLFVPTGGGTWLLTEYDPQSRVFFGLCDIGVGEPELGYVGRDEIEALTVGVLEHWIERDEYFVGKRPLSVYARAAARARRVTEDAAALAAAMLHNRDD